MPFVSGLLALALQLFPGYLAPTHAQGTRKDDIVFNSRGIPLAGATVRVCAMPASGQPCTPLALIYSDVALTQALANPTTTDGLGNYFFYAAPGKYEIEISGPGITTKQLPNIVLPNDPASPTFTGNINAFSLNLSGNLSVTGNTTVIGSLASGTLNLTNQGTAPGSASAGTVNLYTKTADKRLYYKDETGTELGPLGPGVQANVSNTFTATQNFDGDFETKGPNPVFSLTRYGGYSSSAAPSTTGTISSGSATLTLANAQDFANGQGIVVYLAGTLPAASSVITPSTPTVTPANVINGATTYNYKVIAEDRKGGLTAASSAGGTTVGAATLGANTVTLSQCVRTNGVATYTSTSPHNLQAGAQVSFASFSGGFFSACNGVKTIAAITDATHFTTNDGAAPNESNVSAGTATVWACNTLTFANGSYSGNNTLRYWIYRQIGAGAYALAGVAIGLDPWYQDCGMPAPNTPGYVPSTPPSSPQAGYLATTISSGGGTTTLTLAASASSTATAQTVLHDNSLPLKNAIQAAFNSDSGDVYIPNMGAASFAFNSTLDMTGSNLSGCVNINGGGCAFRIHVNSGRLILNQPWLLRGGTEIEGEPHATQSFLYQNGSVITGSAIPFIMDTEQGGGGSFHLSHLVFFANGSQQTAVMTDNGPDGGGEVGIVLDDVAAVGSNGQQRLLLFKGGFDYFFNRGVCEGQPNAFTPYSCLTMTNSSAAVAGALTQSQVPGRVQLNAMYFSGNAMDLDCAPNGFSIFFSDYFFNNSIFESAVAPYLRVNCPGGGAFSGIVMQDLVTADLASAIGTPIVDAQNGGLQDLTTIALQFGTQNQPLLVVGTPTSASGTLMQIASQASNPGNTFVTNANGGGITSNQLISTSGNARTEVLMNGSGAPAAAVSAGGNVPVTTWNYALQWVDVDGNLSFLTPAATVTTTTGNQTVTITPPTPPVGAVAYFPYRCQASSCNYQRAAIASCPVPLAASVVYVDTAGFVCGNSVSSATAGAEILGPNGLSGHQLRLTNNGNLLTQTFPNNLTANRTLAIPDNTGYLPTTSYLNSAYDNATRGNGAIGGSWTVTNGGINIAGNNFQGTAGNNDNTAFWSASPFSPVQFSQATITALNGGSDFAGVAVLVSGSGGSSHSYQCLESTTNIFLQRAAGTTNTTLSSAATTGAIGDLLRLEVDAAGNLTCFKNGVSTLTANDTSYTSGSPGLFLFGNVATAKNWSGGNLHPLAHPDVEQDWTKPQHWNGGIPQDAQSFKHQTVSTGSIGAGACGNLTLTWSSPFLDTNYQAWPSVLDSTSAAKGLTVDHVQAQTAAATIVVVCNGSGGALTGTLQVLAVHN